MDAHLTGGSAEPPPARSAERIRLTVAQPRESSAEAAHGGSSEAGNGGERRKNTDFPAAPLRRGVHRWNDDISVITPMSQMGDRRSLGKLWAVRH